MLVTHKSVSHTHSLVVFNIVCLHFAAMSVIRTVLNPVTMVALTLVLPLPLLLLLLCLDLPCSTVVHKHQNKKENEKGRCCYCRCVFFLSL